MDGGKVGTAGRAKGPLLPRVLSEEQTSQRVRHVKRPSEGQSLLEWGVHTRRAPFSDPINSLALSLPCSTGGGTLFTASEVGSSRSSISGPPPE